MKTLRQTFMTAAVLLVIGGWSAFWFYASGVVKEELDARIGQLAQQGIQISCADREITGYPFRIEVRCGTVDVAFSDGGQVSVAGFRAVALIYKPYHIILEADAPLAARMSPFPANIEGQWTIGHASLELDDGELADAALSFENPDFGLIGDYASQKATGKLAELHLRRAPDDGDAADIALRLKDLALTGTLANASAFDGGMLLRVPDGRDLLTGKIEPRGLIGRPLDVQEVFLSRGTARLTAHGELMVTGAGLLEGELEVSAVEPDQVAALVAPFYPSDSKIPTAFQGALMGLGKKSGTDAAASVSATLTFRDGMIRIGLVPIAQMTPLF
ncbi:DUF2125 domain-containing protein [Breoghania sp.]|uniref:DUF2125 domain-containing protein n=1 Tax=Breoghania sp. TaxID=2065378 RepID=UPI002AA7E37E|nr:DUF2125 domain-containing protein [Breoghania sp.]